VACRLSSSTHLDDFVIYVHLIVRKTSNALLSFSIALDYVMLATACVLLDIDTMPVIGVIAWFFFPAAIMPGLIMFSEREPCMMILKCQLITLLIVWILLWGIMSAYKYEQSC
jgi:hypothetical protein